MQVFYRWTFVAVVAAVVCVVDVVDGWRDMHLFHVQCQCKYHDGKLADVAWQDAFDGTTVLYYDVDNKTFVAVQSIAQAEADRRNSKPGFIVSVPRRLASLCEKIKETAISSNTTLEKMAPTFTRAFVQKKAGRSYLVCLVENFFPSDIKLSWVRNGAVTVNGPVTTRILPQKDRTFQVKSILLLNEDADGSYSCQVEHETINGKLMVPLERNGNTENEALIIIGAVLGILGISSAVVTGILYHCVLNRCKQFNIKSTAKFTNQKGRCQSIPCTASMRSSTSNTSNSSSSSADGLTKSSA
ncbi:SLA class II histocompatibility antigen, DQ haplotype C beta chain-like [Heptranchias perlo]|uniref:SLA class II histocompatibility antigen, DQ haplotype C beta chain-like n=1 Tax=Heptranchias perlo TaxID=212740 RepID=UPI00355A754B